MSQRAMLTASVLFSYKPSFASHFLSRAAARENIRMAGMGQDPCRCRPDPRHTFLQVWLCRGGEPRAALRDEADIPLIFILAKAVVSVCRIASDWKGGSSPEDSVPLTPRLFSLFLSPFHNRHVFVLPLFRIKH